MKLLRLKINQKDGFRSLKQGFEMYFLRDFDYDKAIDFNPYILAGRNGSGKSNILEALAEIFYHLDCIYIENKPEYFTGEREDGFKPEISRVDEYELKYFTFLKPEIFATPKIKEKAHIIISKRKGEKPFIEWENKSDFGYIANLGHKEIKSLLPEYVVGYASGDNETLSLPFFKSRFLQFDAYVNDLKNNQFVTPSPENSLVFLDNSYSQAILLTNLLMQKNNDVLQPFRDYVKLKDVDTFRFVIRTDIKIKIEGSFGEGFGEGFDIDREEELLRNIDLKDKEDSVFVRSYIEKLKRCATTWYEKVDVNDPSLNFDGTEVEVKPSYLILDYYVNDETKKAFQFHFENKPLKLFELFQLLLIQDIHVVDDKDKENIYSTENVFLNQDIDARPKEENRIFRIKDFVIKKEGVDKGIYTKALSDGEHQFLHSLGLCLLFKDTQSLFLLDEPETHFNPDWKAKFISSIRDAFEKESDNKDETMREMLITTHSPYLISDSKSKYVQIFKKNEKPMHPEFQTFGTSVNRITIEVFGAITTMGNYAMSVLLEYEKRFENGENSQTLINELESDIIGDSVEKTMLIHKLLSK